MKMKEETKMKILRAVGIILTIVSSLWIILMAIEDVMIDKVKLDLYQNIIGVIFLALGISMIKASK